jgi:hypothetical protein
MSAGDESRAPRILLASVARPDSVNAQPNQGRFELLVDVGNDYLTGDAHMHLLLTFPQLPGIHPSICRQAEVDAAVLHQVLRAARRSVSLQIFR